MSDKVFKTYEEQISILVSRGINISTDEERDFAFSILSREGYYNIINGYKKPFLKTTSSEDIYLEGTTLKEIYSLYRFDRNLRNVFINAILHIETTLKSLISYHFSEKYGHTNYLLYSNFDTKQSNAAKNITDLLAEIQRQLASRSSDPSISHYLKKYGYVPLWVLNNILTLGSISKFYSLMKQPERQAVSKFFHISDQEMTSFLFYISSIRNFCAHGNRLYCYRTKRTLIDTHLHEALNIPKSNNNEYLYGKRDLYASLIVLKYLLSNNKFSRLTSNIDYEYKKLKISVFPCEHILETMGFPQNWYKEIRLIKTN